MRNVALFLFILSSVKHMLLRGKIRVKTRFLSVSFDSETSAVTLLFAWGEQELQLWRLPVMTWKIGFSAL